MAVGLSPSPGRCQALSGWFRARHFQYRELCRLRCGACQHVDIPLWTDSALLETVSLGSVLARSIQNQRQPDSELWPPLRISISDLPDTPGGDQLHSRRWAGAPRHESTVTDRSNETWSRFLRADASAVHPGQFGCEYR